MRRAWSRSAANTPAWQVNDDETSTRVLANEYQKLSLSL